MEKSPIIDKVNSQWFPAFDCSEVNKITKLFIGCTCLTFAAYYGAKWLKFNRTLSLLIAFTTSTAVGTAFYFFSKPKTSSEDPSKVEKEEPGPIPPIEEGNGGVDPLLIKEVQKLTAFESFEMIFSHWHYRIIVAQPENRLMLIDQAIKEVAYYKELFREDADLKSLILMLDNIENMLQELKGALEAVASAEPEALQDKAVNVLLMSQSDQAISQVDNFETDVSRLQQQVQQCEALNLSEEQQEKLDRIKGALTAAIAALKGWHDNKAATLTDREEEIMKIKKRQDAQIVNHLLELGYTIEQVTGDGNCLFRALEDNDEARANQLRADLGDAMKMRIEEGDEFLKWAIQGLLSDTITSKRYQGFSQPLKDAVKGLTSPKAIEDFCQSEEDGEGWKLYLRELKTCFTMFGSEIELSVLPALVKTTIHVYTGSNLKIENGRIMPMTSYHSPMPQDSSIPEKHILLHESEKHYSIILLPAK